MNEYTVEIYWHTPSGTGLSLVYCVAQDVPTARAKVKSNFERQGYTLDGWGTVIKHSPSMNIEALHPCRNGVL